MGQRVVSFFVDNLPTFGPSTPTSDDAVAAAADRASCKAAFLAVSVRVDDISRGIVMLADDAQAYLCTCPYTCHVHVHTHVCTHVYAQATALASVSETYVNSTYNLYCGGSMSVEVVFYTVINKNGYNDGYDDDYDNGYNFRL